MFWQALASTAKTDLYIIETGTLTAMRYCNEILDQFVRPYAGAIGQRFILMDDNAHPLTMHTSLTPVSNMSTIVRMDWPSRSPDLNLIEHAWDILQHAISTRPVQPRCLRKLKDTLVAKWRLILQKQILTLVTSMRRRYRAVIDARGRHTCY